TLVRTDITKIVPGENRDYAGQRVGFAYIDGFNRGVREGTAQHFAFEEPRKRNVARVLRLPRHLIDTIEAAGWMAYSEKCVLHFLIPRMSRSLPASAGSIFAILETTFSISGASSGSILRLACLISARNCGSFMVS